jgi:nucleoside 2-deoxyribosyltransferase
MSEQQGNCVVCNEHANLSRDPTFMGGSVTFQCEGCGRFTISDQALAKVYLRVNRGLLSGWIRRKWDAQPKSRVLLTVDEIDRFATLPIPSFKERVEEYLAATSKQVKNLADDFIFLSRPLRAAAYCASPADLRQIADYLIDEKMLVERKGGQARLLPKGHIACDELRARRTASSQGFIAMWFDPQMEIVRREGLEVGIRDAGYRPHRVDDVHHVDQISDRIIADIRRSRFVVADLTGHRQGVYYEAGFARGLDKPVFYTCRDDEKDKIHFDIRQFNCIMWTEPGRLAQQLRDRIEAVIGQGPAPGVG